MHVVHVHTNTAWGGGEVQVLQLVQGLSRRGWATSLFTPCGGALFERGRDAGLAVRPLPSAGRPHRFLGGARHLATAIAEEAGSAPLLHAHDSGGIDLCQGAVKKLRCPLVYTRRVASPLRNNWFSRRKYHPARLPMIVAISQTVKDVLMAARYPEERIRVVTDGLDLHHLDELPAPAANPVPLIGGVGSLTPKKNWSFFLQTAAELKRQGRVFRYAVIGSGEEAATLQAQAETLGIADAVEFPGFRQDADARMKEFAVLLFPSLFEGASVTVRQAMALRVPVVCLKTPGCVESLQGTGWVVDPPSPAGAAAAILEALGDDDMRADRLDRARRIAEECYGMEEALDAMIAVYREMGAP